MTQDQSANLMARALHCIPGGVNSPVRAFKAVGGQPPFIAKASGARLFDVNGREYIDYVGSWGPMILGHANPQILDAVQAALGKGLSFGAPCEDEVRLAEAICNAIPSIDKIRMVNSGTEATMSAIRLARGFTGRDKIIKFEGCYHGHADALLVKAGSGALTFGTPSSPGVPKACVADTLTANFNDLTSVEALFEREGSTIAAIIVEPVAGNMNLVLPEPGFLEGLRACCDSYGALLIFDEVMTGFRVSPTGYQGLTSVCPDITTLGKIIGGGMPVGAFGGRSDVMDALAPNGPVYQAGTLSGNPIAMAAGLAMLNALSSASIYDELHTKTEQLVVGLNERASAIGVPFMAHHLGSMFGLFFTESGIPTSFQAVMNCDQDRFVRFFHAMLTAGIYLAPSAFEAGFVSNAHSVQDIEKTLDIAEQAFETAK